MSVQTPTQTVDRPQAGDVFVDTARNEQKVTIVFADEQTVIVEHDDGHRQFEPADQFAAGIGTRWELVDRSEGDQGQTRQASETAIDTRDLQRTLTILAASYAHPGGRFEDPTGEKKAAIEDLRELLDSATTSEVDFAAVSGIGEQTAAALRERGIQTELDLHAADDPVLKAVSGVGSKTVERLRERS